MVSERSNDSHYLFFVAHSNFIFRSARLSAVHGFAKKRGELTTVRCLNAGLIKLMNAIVSTIVGRCEMENGGRVLSMKCDFMMDENEKLWFVRTTDIQTAVSNKTISKMDQAESHNKRTNRATKADVELEKIGHMANVTNKHNPDFNFPVEKDFVHGGVAGSRSENRLRQRELRTKVPDEELVSLIMNEVDPLEALRKKAVAAAAKEEEKKKTIELNQMRARTLSHLVEDDTKSLTTGATKALDKHLRNKNSARSQREINIMSHSKVAAETLGSTQLSGCPGDFCGVNVNIDKALEGYTKENTHLSEFRRKLLEQEGEEFYSSSSHHPSKRSTKSKKKKSKSEVAEQQPTSTVPLKTIIMARHERHLVDVMLRRHANRESGAYCER